MQTFVLWFIAILAVLLTALVMAWALYEMLRRTPERKEYFSALIGLLGTIGLILLFTLFICLGLVVVIRCRDRFARLLAAGIVLTIGIQAALNIGVVTVVLPTKGIPLPFVSAGGTSMLLSSAAVGVLLSIATRSTSTDLPVSDYVSET